MAATGEACLQFEALRTSTAEARASDHTFLGTLALCREAALGRAEASNTAVGLSIEETQLLDLNPPQVLLSSSIPPRPSSSSSLSSPPLLPPPSPPPPGPNRRCLDPGD